MGPLARPAYSFRCLWVFIRSGPGSGGPGHRPFELHPLSFDTIA